MHFFLVFERDMNDLQSLICLENATTCTERLLICQEENIGHWRHIWSTSGGKFDIFRRPQQSFDNYFLISPLFPWEMANGMFCNQMTKCFLQKRGALSRAQRLSFTRWLASCNGLSQDAGAGQRNFLRTERREKRFQDLGETGYCSPSIERNYETRRCANGASVLTELGARRSATIVLSDAISAVARLLERKPRGLFATRNWRLTIERLPRPYSFSRPPSVKKTGCIFKFCRVVCEYRFWKDVMMRVKRREDN